MSLQVWLPLNGNLNNQGLSEVTVTNSGATVDSSGKIGSCYLVNKSSRISFNSYPWMTMKPQYNFSCFFWAKGTTDGWLFACSAWEFRLRPDYIQIHLGGSGYYPARYTATFDTNTWYHLGFTWNGTEGKLRLYLNGNLVATSDVPSSVSYDIASSFNIPYDGPRYINDFRLYDHCLSAREVREISKGLVCHYKLDNKGFGNPNLITTMEPGGRTTLNGKYGLNADFSQNLDTYGRFNVSPALELDSTYTLSFDVSNFPAGGAWNFCLWNNANYNIGAITKDGHYTYTFIPSASKLPSNYSLTRFLFDDGGRTNPAGMVYFTNFKIEKGSVATSWCPHTSDSLYASLSLDSTIEEDCSGYSRNANKANSPTSLSGSPRYEVGCRFTGSEYLTFPNPLTSSSTDFSISCWVKFDNTSDTMTVCTMRSSVGSGIALFRLGSNIFRFDDNTQTTFSSYSVPANTWIHLVVTRSASSKNLYVNGNLVQSTTTVGDMGGLYTTGSIGASSASGGGFGNFTKGAYSDFRIYATALSATDIKELYNTSASIDKNGNMYTYEFKEE